MKTNPMDHCPPEAEAAEDFTEAEVAKWPTLCKRTEDPKLGWLERRLAEKGLRSRRRGESLHAPILKVHPDDEDAALEILDPVDHIPDHYKRFTRP